MNKILPSLKRHRLAFACLVALLFAVRAAWAHQLQVEPVAIVLRPQATFLTAEFSGNIQDITQIPGALVGENERTADGFTEPAKERLEGYLNGNFQLRMGGSMLPGEITELRCDNNVDPAQGKFSLVMRYERPGGAAEDGAALEVSTRLFEYLPNAATILTVGSFARKMAPGDSATIEPENLAANLWTNVANFFREGVHHIFTGYDHMLFILALLLVSTDLKTLVKTLTGFTLAHSVTLVLSTLQVVTPPMNWVEIFVILSIMYVGVENLVLKSTRHRFWVASAFGFVHGFAFAENLRAIGLPDGSALFWSLLSFNLGVEAAQVLLCLVAFPLLMVWKKGVDQRAKYGGLQWASVVKVASCGVIAAGAYWLIQKLFAGAAG